MTNLVIAKQASSVVIPADVSTDLLVLDFLVQRFKHVSLNDWQQRLKDGRVHWQNGELIDMRERVRPKQRIYYYRELAQEPPLAIYEQLLFENEHIAVAFKPHFMAVNPSGNVIQNCLVNRLREQTDSPELTAAHRLDRATAGVMLLVKQAQHRRLYHDLFASNKIRKTYQALSMRDSKNSYVNEYSWQVYSRIEKSEPSFRMSSRLGLVNSHSVIRHLACVEKYHLFELHPISGKTHQLRLHMCDIGYPILNDRLYPALLEDLDDNYDKPLKLLAQKLEFVDPIDKKPYVFEVPGLELNV